MSALRAAQGASASLTLLLRRGNMQRRGNGCFQVSHCPDERHIEGSDARRGSHADAHRSASVVPSRLNKLGRDNDFMSVFIEVLTVKRRNMYGSLVVQP